MAGGQATSRRGGAGRLSPDDKPAILFDCVDDAGAALAAAIDTNTPVMLLTAPGAAACLGGNYLWRCVELAAAKFPAARYEAAIDVASDGAMALEAFRLGWPTVLFTGRARPLRDKLADVARQCGGRILLRRPRALSLRSVAAPGAACRAWLARGRRDSGIR